MALIHFTEKVNPKFPYTLDYVTLMERAGEGGYGAMQLGGPMDVKTACCAESGEIKGYKLAGGRHRRCADLPGSHSQQHIL